MPHLIRRIALCLFVAATVVAAAGRAGAIDDSEIDSFLEVTGFGVALDAIKLSASSAPDMIGLETAAFGSEWTRLVDEVFDPEVMHDLARQILSQTLTEDMLDHAIGFYGSDLGRRLVAAENASHMAEDDDAKTEEGERIVGALVQDGSPRLEHLKHLISAIGSEDSSVRAVQEVQVRFLMAAAAAGVIELQMDEADLRESMRESEPALRLAMRTGALTNAAYTYKEFSDDEIEAYAEALEDPKMREVYDLMNAVQFEIMANRFEATALRLQNLSPSQEL